ncbi:MAG: glycosyltransferase [bacterium]|nr:glycosyltransferase [bacterium]
MRVVMFYHSLISDWNHGNAHFLRGIASELIERGHSVTVYEPEGGWSLTHLIAEGGAGAVDALFAAYPLLKQASALYPPAAPALEAMLDGADLVIVHEWNDPALVKRIGALRKRGRFRLLFHDTHHRIVTAPDQLAAVDLSGFDGVLAYGAVIRDLYLKRGWAAQAWTWHEAADTRAFRPLSVARKGGAPLDVVWVGNWGDDERTAELGDFLLAPLAALKLRAAVYGVRYPQAALDALANAGITYGGWVANYRVPALFHRARVTLHIPRRPYTQALPGIPTIRPFEALACGIPLICAPWDDAEGLFTPGVDYLVAPDGAAMTRLLRDVLHDSALAASLSAHGLAAIRARHTCAHRVDQLLTICEALGVRDTHPLREREKESIP